MNYDRLMKLEKETLVGFIIKKDELIDSNSKRLLKMDKVGKIFFNNKQYWVIFEEISND